jgi:hypothetical protein
MQGRVLVAWLSAHNEATMGTTLSDPSGFLSALSHSDLLMVKVVASPRPQTFRARVERIYTARRGIDASWLGSEIEFVGGTGWGEKRLAVGDTALLFVSKVPRGVFSRIVIVVISFWRKLMATCMLFSSS